MAERRMFTKKITDSDAFIEMSSAAQALYFHLNQGADDDGFNNQVQMAMWKAHASTDDLKILMAKNYIIRFENGVIVIKHWRMHNTLRKDRYTPTNFQEELSQLGLKDNGAYTIGCQMVDEAVDEVVAERLPSGCQVVAERLPSGCQVVAERLPQVSIGKESKGEFSVVEVSGSATATTTTNVENSDTEFKWVRGIFITEAQLEDLLDRLGIDGFNEYADKLAGFIEKRGAHVKSHYDTILKWAREDMRVDIMPRRKDEWNTTPNT